MFSVNGNPCLDPGILRFSMGLNYDCSWWLSRRPNHFRAVCGVDPGSGAVLLESQHVPATLTQFSLQIGPVVLPNVTATRGVQLAAFSVESTPTAPVLLTLSDSRIFLTKKSINLGFNVVESFNGSNEPVYFPNTLDYSGVTEEDPDPVPFTWEKTIKKIWEDVPVIGSSLPYFSNASLPSDVPQDYRFYGITAAEALKKVLFDCGHTLIPKVVDGAPVYYVEPVALDTTKDALFDGLQASNPAIDAKHYNVAQAARLPAKLSFHFPWHKNQAQYEKNPYWLYEVDVTTQHVHQVGRILSGSSYPIIVPRLAIFRPSIPGTPQNNFGLSAYATALMPKLVKLLFTDAARDRTYSGYVNVALDAGIGRITWQNTGSTMEGGSGPITRIEQFFPSDRPSFPREAPKGSGLTTIAITQNIPAATWTSATKKLVPADVDGYPSASHEDADGSLTFDFAADPVTYKNQLFDAVSIAANKFRVGYVIDNILVQVSCEERNVPDL